MKLISLSRAALLGLLMTAAACGDDPAGPGEGPGGEGGGDNPRLTSIQVTAEAGRTEIPVNGAVLLSAAGRDQKGADIATGALTWSSSDTLRARVSAEGLVTGRGNGAVTLTAAGAGGVSGTLSLTVRGSIHSGTITQDETWRAADNPHLVTGDVRVSGAASPRLTIEPGVEIRFAQRAALFIGGQQPGSLTADGTPMVKIRFVADAAAPSKGYFYGVYFDGGTGAGSSIRHAEFNHCGAERGGIKIGTDACIAAVEANVAPVIADVLIQNSGTNGIVMMDGGSFGANSAHVSVNGATGYPLVIGADFAGTLPDGGAFTGNGINRVRVHSNVIVSRTQTWPHLGIAYSLSNDLRIGGAASPVLTLADSVVLRMPASGTIYVGNVTGNGEPGGLVALGSRTQTPAGPVVFTRITADSDAPGKGDWDGILFSRNALAGSRLRNVAVEWAGGADAAIRLRGDRGAFLTDSFITGSAGCGIQVDEEGALDLSGDALNNVFLNNDGDAFCVGDFARAPR
ncbi:MAG TPA: Ig-like domain-containing protein [Longimicrobium sp.]|jgi:hypothetical protein|uniref:Ig-like domain-containing protein n=1 Tax=Longimicrobium sp. TaxID=2029185 RepID=UPI002EDB40C8